MARFVRISPRKARVIVNLIRGKGAGDALQMLQFTRKSAAPIVGKLLESAVANVKQRSGTNVDRLFVKRAFVDKGPNSQMRRWRPRAHGRATKIQKGVSHITLVLDEREE